VPGRAGKKAFIDNLLSAMSSASADHTALMIILRADFYIHCGQYPALRQALSSQQAYIGPMNAEELRSAIEEPARQGGWQFEPGLVDLILREVKNETGALPLLSHALLETWQRRSGHWMTLKGYAEAGGVHSAIARTADLVFNRQLNPSSSKRLPEISSCACRIAMKNLPASAAGQKSASSTWKKAARTRSPMCWTSSRLRA
jgi:hypothetical protein